MYFKKLILLTIIFLLASNAYALKDCPSDPSLDWHNCFGTFTDANGTKYVGEWQNNKPNGQGTQTWADGDTYVGEWKNQKYHGQGTYTFASGNKYVGDYRYGQRAGQGTQTWASGDKHVGEFRNDKMHGQGTYNWADGTKYVGEYRDGKMQGQGTHTWADGAKYVGEHLDDKLHGQGICTSTEGSYNCEWINGELQPYNETVQTAQIKKTKNSTGSKIFAKVGGFLAEAFIEGISKGIQVAIINEFNEPCTPTVRVKNSAYTAGTGGNKMILRKTRVKVKTCPSNYYFLD